MSDSLVRLGANPMARRLIRMLGLPIPLPQELHRPQGPWEEMPLRDLPAITGHDPRGELAPVLARTLAGAGAAIWAAADEAQWKVYKEIGEACGPVPKSLARDEPHGDLRPHSLVFDATGMGSPEDLCEVYGFFHQWIRALRTCGRAVILARPPEQASSPPAAAAAQALDGFVRSMAREIGRKGATAQTIYVEHGAEDQVGAVLRFLLSKRAAYISGQPVRVSTRVAGEGSTGPYQRPLEAKVALLTGAARGIGAATARALAREGAHVICMDRPSEEAAVSKVANEIQGTMLLCDITDPGAPNTISKLVTDRFQGINIVIHNAGVTRDKMLANMDQERWDQAIGVNLLSIIAVNEALDALLHKDGRIVCLASVAGIAGNLGQCNYAASKAGVIGYVQALAPSMAERGITVNAVAPGFIETAMTAAIPFATRQVARRLCNLSQGGQPEDVAEAITFLASPGAAGMSGEVLRVCGGSFVGA